MDDALTGDAAAVQQLSDWVTSMFSQVGEINKDHFRPLKSMIDQLTPLGVSTKETMTELINFMPTVLQAKQKCVSIVEYKLLPTEEQDLDEFKIMASAAICKSKWDREKLKSLCDKLEHLTTAWTGLYHTMELSEKQLQPELERLKGIHLKMVGIK